MKTNKSRTELRNGDKISVTIEFTVIRNPTDKNRKLNFTLADTSVEVSDAGKKIGRLAATLGGGYEISAKFDGRDIALLATAADFFAAINTQTDIFQ